jgi:hypothetical protein
MSNGYDVFEVRGRGLVIQADDDVGVYKSDRDACIACVNDTLGGDIQSAEMLKSVLLQERPLMMPATAEYIEANKE